MKYAGRMHVGYPAKALDENPCGFESRIENLVSTLR